MGTKVTTKTDEQIEVIEEVAKPKKTAKAAKKYGPTDLIECRSVTGGKLYLVGPKSHLQYEWSEYGDTAFVEYQDLQALQSRKSGFLVKPRFIIEDEELVEQWSKMLEPIYSKINEQSLDEFFELPLSQFKAKLQNIPVGFKDAVKTRAVQMIESDELYDIRKVREIDTAFGTDFVSMFMK